MGVCFTMETDKVANVRFAAPGIFHVFDACRAGDWNAQGIRGRGGYGGELHGPAKLNLLCESIA